MVIQKAIDNLKDRPREEKTNVAGAIAIMVVVALLFAWGFFFLKKVQRGEQFNTFMNSAQDEFNPSGVREAQEELKRQWLENQEQLKKLREVAPAGETQTVPQQTDEEGQFGQPAEEGQVL